MDNISAKISQSQLVESTSEAQKFPQFFAAFIATLGGIVIGTTMGWSSPAEPKITGDDGEYGFSISEEQNAWAGSLATLGAACACFPIGYLMDKIGRKLSMLFLVLPAILGWLLIIFAINLSMLYVGRFMIGFAGGAFCVTSPTYTSEIAQDSVRGALGSLFQVMLTIGILLAYVVGNYTTVMVMSIVCAAVPILFGILFLFMPETPYFLVTLDKIDDAKRALIKLRGPKYDATGELNDIQTMVTEIRNNDVSFVQGFSTRPPKLAFIICLSLMFFQPFSGVDAVVFNTTTIFENVGSNLEAGIATIIIGALQVGATLSSTFFIENLGRRILLLVSAFVMTICHILLGVFFYLKYDAPEIDEDLVQSLSWLPLTSLCIFIIAYSVGFGPIPWLVAGELCTSNTKAFVSATGCTFNWLMTFVVTRTFVNMQQGLGKGGTFWLFSGFTFLAFIFVFFVVPETKGKSINEIQRMLNNDHKLSTKGSLKSF